MTDAIELAEQYEALHPPAMLVGEPIDEDFEEELSSVIDIGTLIQDNEWINWNKENYYAGES